MKQLKFFFFLINIIYSLNGFSQSYTIEHLEPAFWWTGMKHSQLQIMVHGENISELSPTFSFPYLTLDSVVRTENKNYLFLYVSLSENTKPGKFNIVFKKEKKEKLSYGFELKQRNENSANRIGFNASDVIYLITPDRFANAIPENDEVDNLFERKNRTDPTGRHGGDIQGIINHLDYIKEMGFTSIWLNPVIENNHKRTSYHGYSTTDYYKTDERFGSNEDYIRLSKEAEKLGIKLIMDQIMNHCGLEHWWTDDMPTNDWYHYAADLKITNHRRTALHDPYVASSDKTLFEKGWFVPSMPDLNQSNRLLADYLIQNSIWWIEYTNLSGVRHDTHPYSGKEFMAEYVCRIMKEYPNLNIVGEEWSPSPIVLAKWLNPSINSDNLPICLPSLMDFPLHISLINALNEDEGWNKGFINLYEMLANDFLYPNPSNLVVFPDNHDMPRFFTQLNEDFDLFKTGLIYIATIRGIPQIYYGTEYLATSPVHQDDGRIRSDFPGGWEGDKINAFTGNGLSKEQIEAQKFTRLLLNWRKNNPVIHNGKLMHFSPENSVYVYFRFNDDKTIMVILNKNKDNFILNTNRFKEIIKDFKYAKDIFTDSVISLDSIELEARKSMVLELSK